MSSSKEWLIRTASNEVSGPFTREAVIEKIRTGALGPTDEVCRANHYWIYLDEQEEVKQQLGIDAPVEGGEPEEDVTETETETQTVRVDASEVPQTPEGESPREAFESVMEEHTAVMKAPVRETARPRPRPALVPQAHVVGDSVRPAIERPLFWRVVTFLLVVIAGVLLGWMLSVLQQVRG